MFLQLPFNIYEEETLEETEDYTIIRHRDGSVIKHTKNGLDLHISPAVSCLADWNHIKEKSLDILEKYFTDQNIEKVYSPYKEGHMRGEFSIRFGILGFFWTPRTLLGIEEHMLALYDAPQLLHSINQYILDFYIKYLDKIFNYVKPDVLYLMEDLSGANGPMISKAHFEEYIGDYYRQLIPFLKSKGVGHVFVDTDGDFNALIPNFISAGVEGFLPMDVNAGMDIVKTRQEYPKLKFIGAFNKLEIAKGKQAIDREFERILPVIKQGGYIPGSDHQVAPSTHIDDYKYYIFKLREMMKQAGVTGE